jgi:hypothetical protein
MVSKCFTNILVPIEIKPFILHNLEYVLINLDKMPAWKFKVHVQTSIKEVAGDASKIDQLQRESSNI